MKPEEMIVNTLFLSPKMLSICYDKEKLFWNIL